MHVSRPLIALLLGTVAFFAVWMTALKPSSSPTSGGSPSGVGQYQSAIDQAHQAVKISGQASVAHGGTLPTTSTVARATATTPAATTTAATTPATTTATATTPASTKPATRVHDTTKAQSTPVASTAAQQRLSKTERALDAGKVVALLFYNPAGADDVAVRQELAAVPADGVKVVKLAVPLSEAGHYTFITQNVQLDASPTLVLIDRAKRATTIVGFTDRFEIAQRVADALAEPTK